MTDTPIAERDIYRPTMSPIRNPSRTVQVVLMQEGPGYDPSNPPEPPAEPLVVADGKGSNWLSSNVFEVGQTVEAKTAEYSGGVQPVSYKCRFSTRASADDPWATNPAVTANFNGLIGYKNIRDAATAERIGDVRWNDFKCVDNKFAGLEMTYAQYSKPFETVGIYNALIVGYSNNNQSLDTGSHPANNPGAFGIITSQTDGMLVDGVKFVNIGAD